MSDIWFTSDTHFGHFNIISYARRPFTTVEEMNETMVERWNAVVKPNDRVYHGGDVFFKGGFKRTKEATTEMQIAELLRRLNGKKTLIMGNHDHWGDPLLDQFFDKVELIRPFSEFGLTLTHLPLHQSELYDGHINIHGHIHEKPAPTDRHINICVEQTRYAPINVEELRIK